MSPALIVLRIAVIIFAVEGLIMLGLPALPAGFHATAGRSEWVLAALDAIALVLISSPLVYFWVIRPYVLARARAESVSQESAAMLQESQRIAQIGSWEWDAAPARRVRASEEVCRILGRHCDHPIESFEEYLAILHPDDRERYLDAYREAQATASDCVISYRIVRPDGEIRQVLDTAEPTFDQQDRLAGYRGTIQDITDLKQKEEALRESEKRLTEAMRRAKLAYWSHPFHESEKGYWFEGAGEILGLCDQEISADYETYLRRVHPHDHERVAATYRASDRESPKRKDYQIEYRFIRPDGRVIWLREVAEVECDAAGAPARYLGTIQDITEQKEAEEALRQGEAMLRESQRITRIGTWEWDEAAGRMSWTSEELPTLFGYARGDPVEMMTGLYDHLHPDDVEDFLKLYEETHANPRPYMTSYRVFKRDGELAHLVERAEPVFDEAGKLKGYRGTFQDVTELREAEERLHQAQKMEAIGQLTGGVAHDFNNLLAVIQGNAELLKLEGRDENARAQAILRASKRGAELTQRLLAFSRQQRLQSRPVDLLALLGRMTKLLQLTLGETIEVETVAGRDLAQVMADPGQVENALLNLAINARDAMPDGGKLTFECQNAHLDDTEVAPDPEAAAGDYVVLAVRDTGTGMTPEICARAFEPFFTTKEVGQGTGLGLSMVYGFAKQSGGHVTIESEPGQGTTIRLYLPRAAAEAKPTIAEPPKDEIPSGHGEGVLVVEDDAEVRALTVAMLRSLGYRALEAGDASEARMVLAGEQAVDLVLSDVVLPGGTTGPALAEELRRDDPASKVIFMSGYPAEAALGNGAMDAEQVLLNKPFQIVQLAKALRDAIG